MKCILQLFLQVFLPVSLTTFHNQSLHSQCLRSEGQKPTACTDPTATPPPVTQKLPHTAPAPPGSPHSPRSPQTCTQLPAPTTGSLPPSSTKARVRTAEISSSKTDAPLPAKRWKDRIEAFCRNKSIPASFSEKQEAAALPALCSPT